MKGVRFHKAAQKWTATVYYGGKNEHIGIYPTEKEAEAALIKRRGELENKGVQLPTRSENKVNYVDNKNMYIEFLVSKAKGKITPELIKLCMKIVKGVSKKFRYNYEEDRYDCEAYSYEVIIKNWHNFDEEKYDNPFSYVTEIVKRAFALQWKRLQKTRLNTISLDWVNEDGKKMMNI